MVDIHSHILWGLDDGARSFEDSVEMLRIALESGTTDIVATPHSNAEYTFAPRLIEERLAQLRLAGTPMPKVLEGIWDGNWAAVLRFPSLAAAEKWYNSAEYRPLKDLRINELTEMNRVLLLEGVAPVTGHQQ